MPTISSQVKDNPLKPNTTSDLVKQVQLALAARHYPLLGTGYFGPATRDAVKAFQTSQGLPVTGVVGIDTAQALDKPVTVVAMEKSTIDITTPPWLKTAIESIGIAEVPGKGDNPVILAMAKACGGNIAKTYHHDEIAWCKMFTEYCLVKNGLKGVDSLWALDNAKLGTKLKGPALGAIACKKRTGGGHTFIIAGRDKNGRIVGVGGNQGDRVSRATFTPSEIVSSNWPDGYTLPAKVGFSSLPIVDSAPLSKREV
jgi:uncharacterized protein (TIGR02594 family)